MKVIQVKCPACSNPIYSKQKDTMFYCDRCGAIHVRGDKGPEKIDYEIAEWKSSSPGDRMYMPFWRLYCSFVINSKKVEGGSLQTFASWVK